MAATDQDQQTVIRGPCSRKVDPRPRRRGSHRPSSRIRRRFQDEATRRQPCRGTHAFRAPAMAFRRRDHPSPGGAVNQCRHPWAQLCVFLPLTLLVALAVARRAHRRHPWLVLLLLALLEPPLAPQEQCTTCTSRTPRSPCFVRVPGTRAPMAVNSLSDFICLFALFCRNL